MTKLIDQALLIRETEEQLFALFAQGKLHGTIHSCVGQEFSAAAVSACLKNSDMVFSNHRGHGHFLAFTGNVKGLIHELRGEPGGVCGGVGGSQHLRHANFIANGVQGNLIPAAAGAAFVQKRAAAGDISVVWIGDGTLGQGVLYETLNIASLHSVPLLIVLEDNGYAQSTPAKDVFAGDLRKRIEGFGVAFSEGSTDEWERLAEISAEIIAKMRTRPAPHFLRISTARLRPHSKGDDTRNQQEVKKLWDKDPLSRLMLNPTPEVARAMSDVKELVSSIITKKPEPQGQQESPAAPQRTWRESAGSRATPWPNYRASLTQALHDLFATDKQALLIGEDVRDPYGGCFKVSLGLSEIHPERVLNWPISEAAMAGFGTGVALRGGFCLVEFMFGDFTLLAMDQISNGAAKLFGLDPGLPLRVVFRAPMGGGKGYGPTHSQNLEKHFLGTPGLQVFALNCFTSPRDLFFKLHNGAQGPALVIENKTLYAQPVPELESFPGWNFQQDEATLDFLITPSQTQAKILLVSYGSYCLEVWMAAQRLRKEFGIACSCLFLSRLSSYSTALDGELIDQMDAVLIFEEGVGYVGLGAEIAAQLSERPLTVKRWSAPESIIPAAPALEQPFRLEAQLVIAEVLEVLP